MANEAERVETLGAVIGFGRLMQLAERIWRGRLPLKLKGGEHSVGPCVLMLVPCPAPEVGNCEWCCGSGRVTKRVAQAMVEAPAFRALVESMNEDEIGTSPGFDAYMSARSIIEHGKAGN